MEREEGIKGNSGIWTWNSGSESFNRRISYMHFNSYIFSSLLGGGELCGVHNDFPFKWFIDHQFIHFQFIAWWGGIVWRTQ